MSPPMTPREIIAKDTLVNQLAQLRHAYTHLIAGRVVDQKQFADGLIAPAIRGLEAITSPEYVHGPTVEKCAMVAEKPHRFANGDEYPLPSGLACATAIRALAKEKQ